MPIRETLTTAPEPKTAATAKQTALTTEPGDAPPTEEAGYTPLAITITAAGRENLTLRALARQAVPVLRRPENTSEADRLRLAQAIADALDHDYDADSPDLPPGPDPCACGGLCGGGCDENPAWEQDGYDPFDDLEYANGEEG